MSEQTEQSAKRRAALPQWAQAEITRLEANVATWKRRALEAARGDGARVGVLDYAATTLPQTRGLPTDARIRFHVDPDDPQSYIDVDLDPGADRRRIRLYASGGTLLYVTGVTNTAAVEVRARD